MQYIVIIIIVIIEKSREKKITKEEKREKKSFQTIGCRQLDAQMRRCKQISHPSYVIMVAI